MQVLQLLEVFFEQIVGWFGATAQASATDAVQATEGLHDVDRVNQPAVVPESQLCQRSWGGGSATG